MKPRIYKKDGQWFLRFGYQPRSFAMFGMEGEERMRFKESCIDTAKVESWRDGLACLRELYKRREVRFQ